ncbi:hypothetical protein FRC09_002963, partial [Ceratobasidium sp. 395]
MDLYLRESVYEVLPPYPMVHYIKASDAYEQSSKHKVLHGQMPWVNDYGVPMTSMNPEVLQQVIASAMAKARPYLTHVACPPPAQEPDLPLDPESSSETGDESSLTDYEDEDEDYTPMVMIRRPASAIKSNPKFRLGGLCYE